MIKAGIGLTSTHHLARAEFSQHQTCLMTWSASRSEYIRSTSCFTCQILDLLSDQGWDMTAVKQHTQSVSKRMYKQAMNNRTIKTIRSTMLLIEMPL